MSGTEPNENISDDLTTYSVDDEDQLQPEDTLISDGVEDPLDRGYSPPDTARGSNSFGTTAYGFFPVKAMDTELATTLVHSANERAAVDDLSLGVDVLRAAARSLLA